MKNYFLLGVLLINTSLYSSVNLKRPTRPQREEEQRVRREEELSRNRADRFFEIVITYLLGPSKNGDSNDNSPF